MGSSVPFPAVSMMTGLFANALGWRRVERERHQGLQDRMVFAARIDREPAGGVRMTDFQSARNWPTIRNRSWTTRGAPEGRGTAAPAPIDAPHLRWRDYYADMRVTVVLRLEPVRGCADAGRAGGCAAGADARPLFIGRKPCLPSAPLFGGFAEGEYGVGRACWITAS